MSSDLEVRDGVCILPKLDFDLDQDLESTLNIKKKSVSTCFDLNMVQIMQRKVSKLPENTGYSAVEDHPNDGVLIWGQRYCFIFIDDSPVENLAFARTLSLTSVIT